MRAAVWILGIVLIDQLTKTLVRNMLRIGESIPVIQGVFHITHVTNYGIGFGLLQGTVPLVIIASIAIIGWLLYHRKQFPAQMNVPISLLLAGAIGNLIDRLMFGSVTDFLDFRIWPVFNVADSAVTIGGLLLVWWFYRS